MPLRDVFLFLLTFCSLPFIIKRPYLGVLLAAWFGYMNPHRFTWGPAFYFKFVSVIAIVTIVGFFMSNDRAKLHDNSLVILLAVFLLWTTFTTVIALNPEGAQYEWKRFFNIQILNFLAIYLCYSRDKLILLIKVITLSLAFFSLKGGIFTLATGGEFRVQGPYGSFIGGNTEIGFVSVIILPLLFFLYTQEKNKKLKFAYLISLPLSVIGILGTHSRGAFLAFLVLCFFFWLKSTKKIFTLIILLSFLPLAFAVMPHKYFQRMETIETYDQDGSAMGRINAWWFAFNLAKDNPLGGGFQVFTKPLFWKYAPEPENHHDAHSIYFEVLAEQGYPGLCIFLTIFFLAFRRCSQMIKKTRRDPSLKWAFDLSRMLQASFVAYAVGGAFLGLAFFDLPYHLVAMTILLKHCLEEEMIERANVVTNESIKGLPAGSAV